MSPRVVEFRSRCFDPAPVDSIAPHCLATLLGILTLCAGAFALCGSSHAQVDSAGHQPIGSGLRWGKIYSASDRQPDPVGEPHPSLDPNPAASWSFPPRFPQADSDNPGRYRGPGDPLEGTSWLNRPFHAGWMVGALFADDLIDGTIEQNGSSVGGYRLGWDFDHYWGLEGRFVFSNVDLVEAGNPSTTGISHHRYWDADLLYYPWGDARWRPYISLGVGWATIDSRDGFGRDVDQTLIALPIGMGVKYYWKNWLALRLSVADNWAIGRQPLSSMHNVSVTGDVEVRFGGRRASYFPYHGGLHVW